MAEVYIAKSGKRDSDVVVVKEMVVEGKTPFKINCPNFIISPLSKSANMYINSIHAGVVNTKLAAILSPDDYNKIVGAVPDTEFYIDTDETFYIKW